MHIIQILSSTLYHTPIYISNILKKQKLKIKNKCQIKQQEYKL